MNQRREDTSHHVTFQDQEVWIQAKNKRLHDGRNWCGRFSTKLNLFEVKWPSLTHLASVKLTIYKLSLQCELIWTS